MTGQRGKQKPIDRLMAAAAQWVALNGESCWTNGYRTGRLGGGKSDAEDNRLYDKEMRQGEYAGECRDAFRRLALKLLREASSLKPSKKEKRRKTGVSRG